VAALIRHGGEHAMADVSLSDGSVVYATAGHPFWDLSAGAFVTAGELSVGDEVLTAGGARLSVTAVVLHEQDLTAYNLSISEIHTYYAGDAAVLVHNKGGEACDLFRGARPGEAPNFTPRANEVKIDSVTGLLKDSHGVSVYDNPNSVSNGGRIPFTVDQSTISPLLKVIQRGTDLHHFEIVPASSGTLSFDAFARLLSQIGLK
jgi:hypothetical protein